MYCTYLAYGAPDKVLVLVLPGITLWRPGVHSAIMKNTGLQPAGSIAPVIIWLSLPGQRKYPPQATRRPAGRT